MKTSKSLKENRIKYNSILKQIVDLNQIVYPELRYIQALWALGIVDNSDRFYEEPWDTIHRIYPKIINLLDYIDKLEKKSIHIKILENNLKQLIKNGGF